MNYPQSTYNFNGIVVTMTWIQESELKRYFPVTQVYGVVFNDKGEILIARESSNGKWQIPGNPNKEEGDLFYQLRCVVELGDLLPQTPDPDRGNVWERMFVPAEKIT